MSTLKVTNLQHPSAASPGLLLQPDGTVTLENGGTIALGAESAVFGKVGVLNVQAGAGRWYLPYAARILSVQVSVGTAPTGAALILDVNLSGTTIFTTQANRPTVAVSTFTSGVVTSMNVTTASAGSYLTVDIDQIGSTVAGSDLTVIIRYTPA